MFSLKTEEVRWFVDIQLNLTQKVLQFSPTPLVLVRHCSVHTSCFFYFLSFKITVRTENHTHVEHVCVC